MMALFKKEKEEKKEEAKESKKDAESTGSSVESQAEFSKTRLEDIIISPRITEKTVNLMDKGVYTFNVRKDANKTEIAKAIKLIYKVEPVKIRIVNYKGKPKMNHKTVKIGRKSGVKKALVYLKEGEKINVL